MNMKEKFITASLDGFGFHDNKFCLYALLISTKENKSMYIGRTGSSGGISSPFGRLGTHLKKRGKTRTFLDKIKDKNIVKSVMFKAVYLGTDSKKVHDVENWAIHNFPKSKGIILLNDTAKTKKPKDKDVDSALKNDAKELLRCFGIKLNDSETR